MAGLIKQMVRTRQCCTELTDAEINDLKAATKTNEIKSALQDAVEYRIMWSGNPTRKKAKSIIIDVDAGTEMTTGGKRNGNR
jgi:hypothetical protein